MNTTTITPTELARHCQQGQSPELIDVRTPAEFRALHVAFAKNVPLDRLDAASVAKERNGASGEPLYVICQSGRGDKRPARRFAWLGAKTW